MKITEQEVRYVADLANLKLSDDEILRMAHDLDEILTHAEKLQSVDTSGVEPMAQVLYQDAGSSVLREDREHTPLPNADAVGSAPAAGAGYFKVPRVIER